MLTMDGTFIDCNGQAVDVSDEGSIAVAHPVEIPVEELECWKTLLADQRVPTFCADIGRSVTQIRPWLCLSMKIELPMFLVRGLAKEGIDVVFLILNRLVWILEGRR